jgi:tetratricopeptide (TPR) repeat protein
LQILHYTRAIDVGHTSQLHVYLSNRSAAYVAVGNFASALDDATRSVDLNPNWWKGYLRKGTALLALGRFTPAADVFRAGLKLKPGNEFLVKGLEQAEEGAEKRKAAAPAAGAASGDGASDATTAKLNKAQPGKGASSKAPAKDAASAVAAHPATAVTGSAAAPSDEVSPELAAIMTKRAAAAAGKTAATGTPSGKAADGKRYACAVNAL